MSDVHLKAKFASGDWIACDPTNKGPFTTDPYEVTCNDCRRVIRWRVNQIPHDADPSSNELVICDLDPWSVHTRHSSCNNPRVQAIIEERHQ